jgi:hypothetical protein
MIALVKEALMITGFVAIMMLVIEYLNVASSGAWQSRLAGLRWGQYVMAALLGAAPGCLGAFAVVSMFSHGLLTRGAVIATMIATSGDEAFVMLALFPRQALLITAALFLLGVAAGMLVDAVAGPRKTRWPVACQGFQIHPDDLGEWFAKDRILARWKHCTPTRGIVVAVLVLFFAAIVTGQVGPPDWNWVRVSLALVTSAAIFIVAAVSDHFLEEHLWRHVLRKHVPRLFLWTLGALVAVRLLAGLWDLSGSLGKGKWIVLLAACLVGLVPESGPHLIFVALYAQGLVPVSVLLASSVVQDGHGMLPMLAHSRREFVEIKAINLTVGLLAGAMIMALGF